MPDYSYPQINSIQRAREGSGPWNGRMPCPRHPGDHTVHVSNGKAVVHYCIPGQTLVCEGSGMPVT